MKNVTGNVNFPDDSLVPQIYHPEDQSNYCMWQIFVPDGSYVNLTMYGSMQGDDLYMLEYTYNISIEIEDESQLVQNQPRTFYIPAGLNYLILYCPVANGGCFNSTIAFSIVYQKLPSVQPTLFSTGSGLPSIVLTDDDLYNTPVVITSLSGSVININIAAENNQNNSLPYNGYIIFAGNGTDGVPLGSVFPWQIMTQLYYNSQITIIKVDNSMKTAILISSDENVNYFAPAPVLYWHSQKTTTYSLKPWPQLSTCIIIYSPNCDPEYITDIKFSGNSTIVSVIGTSPTSGFDNMLAQYRKINAADNFPQRVSGMLRTFVVENGQANITTSYNDTAVIS
ncbi:hypothetical protein WR25_25739 [Diploscapter pachys]|uniref:DUF7591 domain-containing protein n=1 Tax=Diploscapter pachys TaxID=2018661 RepID=A0A2A2JDG6_9BILA|nr:hypothetical protein WR25_25739 [Diploscapter pachys]